MSTQTGSIQLTLEDGRTFTLVEGVDFDIVEKVPEHLVMVEEGNSKVIIDVKLDDVLITEGIARQFIRKIQDLRKDMKLEIEDHITICWTCDYPEIQAAFKEYHNLIRYELLADSFTNKAAENMIELDSVALYKTDSLCERLKPDPSRKVFVAIEAIPFSG